MSEQAEKQRALKYRDHDLPIEDISDLDIETVRGAAIRAFSETKEGDRVKLIVSSFLGYLTSKGYRIVKQETSK